MRKLEKRAIMCLMLTAILFLGLALFAYRYVVHGAEWAGFYGNTQIFSDGKINRGTIYDRNGIMLMNCTPDGPEYPDDYDLRVSTIHVVGDVDGNIADGAITRFSSQLIGYDIVNGIYDSTSTGKSIELTIDSQANRTAYQALWGRTGMIGVINYKTGEIMCEVSTPAFDPIYDDPSSSEQPVFFNNFLQGTLTPGSIFKLVTSAAAIENIPDLEGFRFECDGVNEYKGVNFTCVDYHGEEDFIDSLANSCNGAFGEITRKLGADVMSKYVKKLGLTDPVDIDGIKSASGTFNFPEDDDIKLSWSGAGQGDDLINPCSMLVYVAAIANDGEAIKPTLIKDSNFLQRLTGHKSMGQYLDKSTARKLRAMMKNNVVVQYGEGNFPDLDIYAKTGTAEVGTYYNDGWFTGFIDDPDHPYAFICWVKEGNSGTGAAAPIVRSVLYTLIENN